MNQPLNEIYFDVYYRGAWELDTPYILFFFVVVATACFQRMRHCTYIRYPIIAAQSFLITRAELLNVVSWSLFVTKTEKNTFEFHFRVFLFILTYNEINYSAHHLILLFSSWRCVLIVPVLPRPDNAQAPPPHSAKFCRESYLSDPIIVLEL